MTFNELAAKHRLGLLKFLMWKTRGDLSLSEDLCQLTLMHAFTAFPDLDDKAMFPRWIRKIAVNAFINHIQREKSFVNIDDVKSKAVTEDEAIDSRMVHKQNRDELMELVYNLSEQQRKTMALRLFEDMSFKEIAEALSVPYDTAKANYRHGMLKIETIMLGRQKSA